MLPHGLLNELPHGVPTPRSLMRDVLERSMPISVQRVSPHGKLAKVYDLSLDTPLHGFIANGFIVHNCFDSVTYGLYHITQGGTTLVNPISARQQNQTGMYEQADRIDLEKVIGMGGKQTKNWLYR